MNKEKLLKVILSFVACAFGLVTVITGSSVLRGADPGYIVFVPLLIYNSIMGVLYIITGAMAWRNISKAKLLAGVILSLNILVFGGIFFIYSTGSLVALESVMAMTLRTFVWLVIFRGFSWLVKKNV